MKINLFHRNPTDDEPKRRIDLLRRGVAAGTLALVALAGCGDAKDAGSPGDGRTTGVSAEATPGAASTDDGGFETPGDNSAEEAAIESIVPRDSFETITDVSKPGEAAVRLVKQFRIFTAGKDPMQEYLTAKSLDLENATHEELADYETLVDERKAQFTDRILDETMDPRQVESILADGTDFNDFSFMVAQAKKNNPDLDLLGPSIEQIFENVQATAMGDNVYTVTFDYREDLNPKISAYYKHELYPSSVAVSNFDFDDELERNPRNKMEATIRFDGTQWRLVKFGLADS